MAFNFSDVFGRVLTAGAAVATGLKQAHIGGTADQAHYDKALMLIEVLAGLYQTLTAPPAAPPVSAPQVTPPSAPAAPAA